jgi:transmembrane sensor
MSQGEHHDGADDLRQEACAWVMRMQSAEATSADAAELLRWRSASPEHAKALREAVRLRRLIVAAGTNLRASSPLPAMGPVSGSVMGRRAFLGGAIAASTAGVMVVDPPLGLWPSLAEMRADYRTGTGQTRRLNPATGVSVVLNTRTSLSLGSDEGEVGLRLISGEISVEAEHPDRPIAIHTDAGSAISRGGKFGVRLVDAGTCVTCFDGEVRIETATDRRAVLTARQQLTFSDAEVGPVIPVDPLRVQAWRRGLLVFVDEPLGQVVDELNRYRPGLIVLANSNLRHFPVNAVYQLDRLDGVVAQISEVAHAHATSLPGGMVVLS